MERTYVNPFYRDTRGGKEETLSYAKFVDLAKKTAAPVVVTGVVIPDLGTSSWGGLKVKKGHVRPYRSFRREF